MSSLKNENFTTEIAKLSETAKAMILKAAAVRIVIVKILTVKIATAAIKTVNVLKVNNILKIKILPAGIHILCAQLLKFL